MHRLEQENETEVVVGRAGALNVGPHVEAPVAFWTEQLDREIRAYRRKRFWRRMRIAVGVGLLLAFALTLHKVGNLWLYWWLIFGGGAALQKAAERSLEAAEAVAQVAEPRALNVLALAWRDGDDDTRRVAEKGLIRLLPGLIASDAAHITPEGMEALVTALDRSRKAELTLTLLKALEQVGDERALPVVERLANMGNDVSEARDREISEEARACLPFLRERAAQARMRATLLRPASAPDDPSALLLRPAASASPLPEAQLLRPSQGPEGESSNIETQ